MTTPEFTAVEALDSAKKNANPLNPTLEDIFEAIRVLARHGVSQYQFRAEDPTEKARRVQCLEDLRYVVAYDGDAQVTVSWDAESLRRNASKAAQETASSYPQDLADISWYRPDSGIGLYRVALESELPSDLEHGVADFMGICSLYRQAPEALITVLGRSDRIPVAWLLLYFLTENGRPAEHYFRVLMNWCLGYDSHLLASIFEEEPQGSHPMRTHFLHHLNTISDRLAKETCQQLAGLATEFASIAQRAIEFNDDAAYEEAEQIVLEASTVLEADLGLKIDDNEFTIFVPGFQAALAVECPYDVDAG